MNADDLIRAVEQALGTLQAAYRGNAEESDLYEAALFSVAVGAAEGAAGTSILTNDGRTRALSLRFRRAPGNLWNGNFSYALVSFASTSKQVEVHLGVYVLGGSGVAHECDIAILDSEEAERSRIASVHPRRTGLIAAIEAKHYHASPGIGIGRSFLGLSNELGGNKCSLAFPAPSSASLATLLSKKPSECFDELVPDWPAADRLRAHLNQAIRNWRARA